ncbi:hypothetical protein B296_00007454 [Ensete ventricosum]|uniref:Uncharacterized protein n=1 Tax=Ensete ventricosum TaxID=4639 RepID=A0A426ZWE0_ENSVE|nr:hypothetical protein B296_00007454 [Ensete ventricosum]
MGAGKSSLVLRFVKGQFLEFQVLVAPTLPFFLLLFPLLRSRFGFLHDSGLKIRPLLLDRLQESTIGAAFFSQTLAVSDATVKLEIWDTAGQERYHSLAPMYYRGAAASIIVYDISIMVCAVLIPVSSTGTLYLIVLGDLDG